MKVAVATRSLTSEGGIERYTTEAVAALVGLGHDVTVVTAHADPTPRTGCTVVPLRPLPLPASVQVYAELAAFGRRATKAARSLPAGHVLYRPLGQANGPGVVTAHSCHAAWLDDRDRVIGRARPNLLDRVLLAQERRTYRTQDLVVTTVSPRCAGEIAHHYGIPASTIAITPPAIDSNRFTPRTDEERHRARAALGLPDDRFVVGTVANYSFARKRVTVALEACARIDSTFLVAGTAGRDGSGATQRAAEIGADLRLLGGISDMRSFYAGLDAFVLPSINESYGMAAHEAMAVGVPVLVSDRCGMTDFLRPGVEAVVLPDQDCYAEGIAGALDEIRRSGGPTAEAGLTWAHSRQWADLGGELERALERAPRAL